MLSSGRVRSASFVRDESEYCRFTSYVRLVSSFLVGVCRNVAFEGCYLSGR